MTRFDEFPPELAGLSIHQCFDASNECMHGNLPFDGVVCGCWLIGFRAGEVIRLPGKPGKRRRAA